MSSYGVCNTSSSSCRSLTVLQSTGWPSAISTRARGLRADANGASFMDAPPVVFGATTSHPYLHRAVGEGRDTGSFGPLPRHRGSARRRVVTPEGLPGRKVLRQLARAGAARRPVRRRQPEGDLAELGPVEQQVPAAHE